MKRSFLFLAVFGYIAAITSILASIQVSRPPVPSALRVMDANLAHDPLSEKQKAEVLYGLRTVESLMKEEKKSIQNAYTISFLSLMLLSTGCIIIGVYEKKKRA